MGDGDAPASLVSQTSPIYRLDLSLGSRLIEPLPPMRSRFFVRGLVRPLVLVALLSSSAAVRAEQTVEFKLSEVRLLDGPFKHAQDLDRNYLHALEPDRLLAGFRSEAGLKPKAQKYPNWESSGLDGHTAGHYLTALAQMWAATGDAEMKQRLDYMVAELAACQRANGDGYVGAVPGGRQLWSQIGAGQMNVANGLNGAWVPWYNVHKTFAGLRDAWLIGGNAEARDVLIRLGDWCDALCAKLSDTQMQEMLRAEHGGMNEVLADVSAITGDTKYLTLAKRFSHRAILEPLQHHEDKLTGLHANTQIPKVIGFTRIAELSGDASYREAAEFFWDTVVSHRSVVFGGNSVSEHFNPSDDFSSMLESREGPETCNTYNMLRLTEQLFRHEPVARFADYYERALYNHILSSQHPGHGGFVYFTPIRPQHYRVYSQPTQCFWCCVGTGMENHGKYGEFIYAHTDDALLVNLFLASELNWADRGLKLRQETNFPDESRTRLVLTLAKPQRLTLRVRHPGWVAGAMAILVNGQPTSITSEPSSYADITREWRDGDRVEIDLPMHTAIERLPDGSDYVAVLHGPIVLAAKTGTENLDGIIAGDSRMGHVAPGPYEPLDAAPMLVGNVATFAEHIMPVKGRPLTFTVRDLVRPAKFRDLELVPFFRVHDARTMLYWRATSPDDYANVVAKLATDEKARIALDERTIDRVAPGEQQPEVEHHFKSENSNSGSNLGRAWRDATGWFSYDLKTTGNAPIKLLVTYDGGDAGRNFDILVNDHVIATVALDGKQRDRFVDVSYPIPAEIVAAASDGVLTVKFVAKQGSRAGAVYGLRLIRD